MTYFTSDTHFGHANIIKYCARPFKNVNEMHSELIRRWNARVSDDDQVFHLGDFAFGSLDFQMRICSALRGKKILVRGNHDRKNMLQVGFGEVHETIKLFLPEGIFRLSHVPPGWSDERRPHLSATAPDPSEHVTAFLCGHVHEKWATRGKAINVGVDQRDFEPKKLSELLGENK